MFRIQEFARTSLACICAISVSALLIGCPDDPYDPQTWIDKLGDPAEREQAVTELQRLKSPKAIKPLGKAWLKQNRAQKILTVIIDLAKIDLKAGGTKWPDAVPFLIQAVEEFDVGDQRSISTAIAGAAAIGEFAAFLDDTVPNMAKLIAEIETLPKPEEIEAKLKEARKVSLHEPDEKKRKPLDAAVAALEEELRQIKMRINLQKNQEQLPQLQSDMKTETIEKLIATANKPMPKLSQGQRVRLSAIAALGKFGNEPRAVRALVKVLNTDKDKQPPQIFGAAVLALADARSPETIVPLLKTMYEVAPLYSQCRRALVGIGKPLIVELIKIFEGKHEEMNKLAKKHKFNIGCDKAMGPDTSCMAPTNLEFKAASLLADMYAKDAVPALLASLKQKPLPAFFMQGAPGPTQHMAVLNALQFIGDPKSAEAVRVYYEDPKTLDSIRPRAIDVYSHLTTDTKALVALGKKIKNDGEEEQIRMASGLTYARLVRKESDFEPLNFMVDRYRKEADKNEPAAKKAKTAMEAAEKVSKEASAASFKAKGDAKLKAAADKAKATLDEKKLVHRRASSKVNSYRDYQRTFEQYIARAHTGVRCKLDPKCYADTLSMKPEAIAKTMEKQIKNLKKWTAQEKKDLKVSASERSLIELAKMGPKAAPVLNTLLELAGSTDRITRQGALLALVRSAKLPCDSCVTRLNTVLKEQADQSTLKALADETQVVRNYFLWAGR